MAEVKERVLWNQNKMLAALRKLGRYDVASAGVIAGLSAQSHYGWMYKYQCYKEKVEKLKETFKVEEKENLDNVVKDSTYDKFCKQYPVGSHYKIGDVEGIVGRSPDNSFMSVLRCVVCHDEFRHKDARIPLVTRYITDKWDWIPKKCWKGYDESLDLEPEEESYRIPAIYSLGEVDSYCPSCSDKKLISIYKELKEHFSCPNNVSYFRENYEEMKHAVNAHYHDSLWLSFVNRFFKYHVEGVFTRLKQVLRMNKVLDRYNIKYERLKAPADVKS